MIHNAKEKREYARATFLNSAIPENNYTPICIKDLAKLVGVSSTTVHRWVSDLRPSIESKAQDNRVLDKDVRSNIKAKIVAQETSLTALQIFRRHISDLARKQSIKGLSAKEIKIAIDIVKITNSLCDLKNDEEKITVEHIFKNTTLEIEGNNKEIVEAQVYDRNREIENSKEY